MQLVNLPVDRTGAAEREQDSTAAMSLANAIRSLRDRMAQWLALWDPKTKREISPDETRFLRETAFPPMDRAVDSSSLESLAGFLWSLCEWERQRADALDRKASYLLGFSGLAAAVMATFRKAQAGSNLGLGGLLVIGLFVVTVMLSVRVMRVRGYGGFSDEDVFEALDAHTKPVGVTPQFSDRDPYRCFLRESSMQRWLVYRWHTEQNHRKAIRLGQTQVVAVMALVSLLVILLVA